MFHTRSNSMINGLGVTPLSSNIGLTMRPQSNKLNMTTALADRTNKRPYQQSWPLKRKRSLSEALTTKCNLEPPRKKSNLNSNGVPKLPLAVLELRAQHVGEVENLAIGMHPSLAKADRTNKILTKKIRRVEEMAQFWKSKSVTLAEDLNKSRTEISMLQGKLQGVERERLCLAKKLKTAQLDNSNCMEAIKSLMSENNTLKFVSRSIEREQEVECESKDGQDRMSCKETCEELEEALEDTLADLTERLEEIEQLKAALAKTTVERDELLKVVSRDVIKSAIANMDDQAESSNAPAKRIAKLQAQVEKCMFRIALLTQKNEELRKVSRGESTETDLLKTLEDSQKLEVLESLCMQRYRKLLRDTASNLVETGEDEDLEDESFDLSPCDCSDEDLEALTYSDNLEGRCALSP